MGDEVKAAECLEQCKDAPQCFSVPPDQIVKHLEQRLRDQMDQHRYALNRQRRAIGRLLIDLGNLTSDGDNF